MRVQFKKALDTAQLPVYSTKGAAGADVYSAKDYKIPPGDHMLVDTGLDCVIPEGYELQIRPRSGLALKSKITVLNSPGTIDSDYTGRLCVVLINHSDVIFNVKTGDRIAQLVIAPVTQATFEWTDQEKQTERGSGGFGSTGV